MLKIESCRHLASSSITLLDEFYTSLPNSLVFDNWNDLDVKKGEMLRSHVYGARSAKHQDVRLLSFDEPVTVFGRFFSTKTSKGWMLEQTHPKNAANPAELEQETKRDSRQTLLESEVMLIARFGVATWGHWLGELLPKIVLAEQFFPDRFRYILPMVVFNGPEGTIWSAIRESLAAYGVSLDRCVPIRDWEDLVYNNLHYITPVWSEYAIHPGAVSSIRNGLVTKIQSRTDGARQVALLRTETPTRKIGNINDVLTLLQREGFNSFEVGRMPFLEQVSLFMNAETVVAVLGSSLTGLLYAPKNIKVVSMAPENFSDRFFYAMIQNRHGYYADVRGNVTETAALYHWATFNVNPTTVAAALSTLNQV